MGIEITPGKNPLWDEVRFIDRIVYMLYFIHIDVKDFDSNFQDLYFLLSFVFVLLSGSRLLLSFAHRCSPLFILCFLILVEFLPANSRIYLMPF